MHTQVVIIGGGPAGLLPSQILHLRGVESVVLQRIRAGLLEWNTVEILRDATGLPL